MQRIVAILPNWERLTEFNHFRYCNFSGGLSERFRDFGADIPQGILRDISAGIGGKLYVIALGKVCCEPVGLLGIRIDSVISFEGLSVCVELIYNGLKGVSCLSCERVDAFT